MKFPSRYSESKKIQFKTDLPSLTDQSFKDECDLGFIVENYLNKGIPIPESTMNYVDCTTVQQFEEAQMIVAEAKSNFEQLPAKDRDRFKTVENYLDFISNPINLKESYEKGYIDPSSVDLSDVYKESIADVKQDEKPQEKPSENVSVTPSTEPTE